MIALRLAVRNLFRNRWRTGLTMGGVAVAVALMVWTLSFYEGWIVQLVRGATAMQTGQVQLQTAAWAEEGRAYQAFDVDRGLLERVAAVPGVRAASPRVVGHGLVGNEERSDVARLLGVDPSGESRATPVVEGVEEGRWLAPTPREESRPREAVLGADLARRLRVGTGAELVVVLEAADGSLGNDLLEVVGVVRTLDRMGVWLHLDDARRIMALEGRAHALLVRTDDPDAARETAEAIVGALRSGPTLPGGREVRLGAPSEEALESGAVAGGTLVVRPWQEIQPGMARMILIMRRSYWFVYLIIYLVAAVGIVNTQRMSAVERRREFGVMMAVGVRARRMFGMVQVETVTLAVAGALLGALLGGGLAWYHTVRGFDMSLLTSQADFTYMGVSFTGELHFVMGPWIVAQPLLVMLLVALLSGLWPALTAARVDPGPTIAGRVG